MQPEKSKHQGGRAMTNNFNTERAGQGKTARGRARVLEITAAARALFIQGGYAEMTMRQVAERVGITLSNVQHYFPTRESLLRAMLDEVMNSYDPAFAQAGADSANPREKLAAIVRYLLTDSKKPETEKLFVEMWSLATREPLVREIFDRMYTHHRENLGHLIAAVNPALSAAQTARRAALAAMQIEGLMLLISEDKPRHAELAGVEEECVAAIMRMVESAPAF